jgi:hypothetical protein
MRRRTSNLPIRVYTYGCSPPTANAALVAEQMELAHRYRLKLLEIELERRERFREVMGGNPRESLLISDIFELQLRLKALQLDTKNKRNRAALATKTEPIRSRIKELRSEFQETRRRRRADPETQAAIQRVDAEAGAAVKAARAECGCYWGNYLLVETAMDSSRRTARVLRVKPWDGGGTIGVQLQGRVGIEAVLQGRCEYIRIDPLCSTQWETRGGRRAARTQVHMRVCSDAKRRAVWATFPMVMHRPIPADARIISARIVRRRRAGRESFECQLVLESAAFTPKYAPESAPVAAVDLGWRVRAEGLRVGMLVDERGTQREIILPRVIIDRLEHADSIRGVRDRNLNAFKSAFEVSMYGVSTVPPWMLEELNSAAFWRSPGRVHDFVSRWARERAAGAREEGQGSQAEAFALADAWRQRDLHLLQWESHERSRALGHRRELYRKLASELSQTYSAIVLSQYSLSALARRKFRGDPRAHNRALAGLWSLRLALERRAQVRWQGGIDHTRTCSLCWNVEAFDASQELHHVCSSCGQGWDQDVNAARNLLASYMRSQPRASALFGAQKVV